MERKIKKKSVARAVERAYATPEGHYQTQAEPMKQHRYGNTDHTNRERKLFNVSKLTSTVA